MTGTQLMQLGKSSPAARSCIPLNMDVTAPRLRYDNGWVAEFWYYASDYRNQSVGIPQFYLALELPAAHPVRFTRISRTACCLGQAPELARQEFYTAMQAYLERAAQAVKQGLPDQKLLDSLEEEWLRIQPAPLNRWLTENREKTEPVSQAPTKQPGQAPAPENLVEYWKREMTRAIRAGDSQSAKRAQQEMNKAADMLRRK